MRKFLAIVLLTLGFNTQAADVYWLCVHLRSGDIDLTMYFGEDPGPGNTDFQPGIIVDNHNPQNGPNYFRWLRETTGKHLIAFIGDTIAVFTPREITHCKI